MDLKTMEHVSTMQGQTAVLPWAKQVGFVENGSKVVMGTDLGKVVVFDSVSGTKLQELRYSPTQPNILVQVVAVCARHPLPPGMQPDEVRNCSITDQ